MLKRAVSGDPRSLLIWNINDARLPPRRSGRMRRAAGAGAGAHRPPRSRSGGLGGGRESRKARSAATPPPTPFRKGRGLFIVPTLPGETQRMSACGWGWGWRGGAGPGQHLRGRQMQRPAERPQHAGHRRGGCCEQRRHLRLAQQVVELGAKLHRLRHQLQQPAECSRQRAVPTRLSGGGLSAWGKAARAKRAGLQVGGEAGEISTDGSDPAEEHPEDRRGKPPQEVLRRNRLAQPSEDGGEVLGRGGGGRMGHGTLLV